LYKKCKRQVKFLELYCKKAWFYYEFTLLGNKNCYKQTISYCISTVDATIGACNAA